MGVDEEVKAKVEIRSTAKPPSPNRQAAWYPQVIVLPADRTATN